MKYLIRAGLILGAVLFVFPTMIQAGDRSGEEINRQVLSGGGTDCSSTGYRISGTVSQTAVGSSSTTGYGLNHGFWQDFGGDYICDCFPGDIDNNSSINILDVVRLINYKYKGGAAPVPYELCNGDPNADCLINVLDVVHLINYKFKEGADLKTCEEWVAACGLPLRK